MTAPTGGEIAIYQARTRSLQKRLVVGLTEPQWTAAVTDTFGSTLSPVMLMYSDGKGGPPITLAGSLLIRGFGYEPDQWVQSRRGWFPNDTTKAFKVEIPVTFPQTDPIYPQVITVGSIDHNLGQEYVAARVIQAGSASPFGVGGKFYVHGAGFLDEMGFAYNGSAQTLLVEWDPDAAGGAGAEKLTVKWNGVTIAEISDDPSGNGDAVAPPSYWHIGFHHSPYTGATSQGVNEAPLVDPGDYTPLGSIASPATLMSIASVTVSEDGNGYETEAWPTWTTVNAGGTIDTAADGERFSLDSVTWARFPNAYIVGMDVSGPSRDGVSNCQIKLSNMASSGTDRFQTERWVGRPILIDTRMANDAGTFTAWKRLGCFIVQTAAIDAKHLVLEGRVRPFARLDLPLALSWSAEVPDANQDGPENINTGYTMDEVFGDVVDICDQLAGGTLSTTDRTIYAPPLSPRGLDAPGISLLEWWMSLADRMVQEVWVRHTTSGTGRYGLLKSNLWTFGTGTSEWIFYGRGGASVSDIVGDGPILHLNGRGPGMVLYRQDNPMSGDFLVSILNLPLVSSFPGFPTEVYPENGFGLEDSFAEFSEVGIAPGIAWPDRNGIDVFGGIANFRYRQERAECRYITFEVLNHDWMEVGDEIAIDDPLGRNLTAETFVISSVDYVFDSENRLRASIKAVTTSLRKATDVFA